VLLAGVEVELEDPRRSAVDRDDAAVRADRQRREAVLWSEVVALHLEGGVEAAVRGVALDHGGACTATSRGVVGRDVDPPLGIDRHGPWRSWVLDRGEHDGTVAPGGGDLRTPRRGPEGGARAGTRRWTRGQVRRWAARIGWQVERRRLRELERRRHGIVQRLLVGVRVRR